MQTLLTAVGRPVYSLESFGRGRQVGNATGWCHGLALALKATTAAAATSTAPATALAITGLATMAIALDTGLATFGKTFTIVLAVRGRIIVPVAQFSRSLLGCDVGMHIGVVTLLGTGTTITIPAATPASAAAIAPFTGFR